MTASTTAGRPRLRELRCEAGWTQQQLAEKLAYFAWTRHHQRVAVNADMVAKWERGVKGVSPRYRELLCHLFGVTPNQLGLANTPTTVDAQRMHPLRMSPWLACWIMPRTCSTSSEPPAPRLPRTSSTLG